MTTTQILDAIAPYTAADSRCGRRKKRKMEYRYQLLLEIEEQQKFYTNEEILNLLLCQEKQSKYKQMQEQ